MVFKFEKLEKFPKSSNLYLSALLFTLKLQKLPKIYQIRNIKKTVDNRTILLNIPPSKNSPVENFLQSKINPSRKLPPVENFPSRKFPQSKTAPSRKFSPVENFPRVKHFPRVEKFPRIEKFPRVKKFPRVEKNSQSRKFSES